MIAVIFEVWIASDHADDHLARAAALRVAAVVRDYGLDQRRDRAPADSREHHHG